MNTIIIKISSQAVLKYIFAFLACTFISHVGTAQINLQMSSTDNFQCDGVTCEYDGPSILINEVQMAPPANDGSFFEPATGRQGEWIELYNPDECKSIDISCYYLGNAASDGALYSGGYVVPAGTLVPPLGFVVIRGVNAPRVPNNRLIQNGGNTYEYTTNGTNSCIGPGGGRLWFPNAGGWFAFYDQNGVPQDAIRWGNPAPQDLAAAPCKPSIAECDFTGALLSFNNIPNNRKTLLQNNAVNPSPQTFQRSPDGGAWINGEGGATIGNCNGACTPIQTISCNGTVTVVATGGTAPYRYTWNDSRQQTTRTANGLCAGTYCVDVRDDQGRTSTACVEVKDFVPDVQLNLDEDICEDVPAFPLTGGSPPNGVDGATGTYSGTGVSGSTFNPASAVLGENEIEYVYVDSATCTDTARAIINVRPLPETEANADTTVVCLGDQVLLFGTGAEIYEWADGVQDSVPFVPTETKFYILSGKTEFGCELIDSIEIVVSIPLEAGVGDTIIYCPGDDAILFDHLENNDPDGRWEAVENPSLTLDPNTGRVFNSDNLEPGIYQFYYITEPDAPCLNDTATVVMNVPDKPIISDLVTLCRPDRLGYTVEFTITGGEPSTYNVLPAGSITANAPFVYTSPSLANGQEVTFYVSDGFGCGLDSVVTVLDCSCTTSPGTMRRNDVISLCGDVNFDGMSFFNNDSVNDGNDDFFFFLHEGNGFRLVNAIDSNKTGVFSFDPATMNRDQTYYVSTVMADSLQPNGGLDYQDVCFSVSRGTPVVWHLEPIVGIGQIDTLCIDNNGYNLELNKQVGKLPIEVGVRVNEEGAAQQQVQFIMQNDDEVIAFSPPATTTFNLMSYEDANGCAGTIFPQDVEVVVNNPIVVNLSTVDNPACSSPNNLAELRINIAADEDSVFVVISNDFNTNLDTIRLFNQTQLDTALPYFDPNQSIEYQVLDAFATTVNKCSPDLGNPVVIHPSPTASFGPDGVYCQVDPVLFDFIFTGIGPWEVEISDGNGNNFVFQTPDNQANFSTSIVNVLQPGNYLFTIVRVEDLSTGCTQMSGNGQANVTINPSPMIDLFVLDDSGNRAKNYAYCLGNGPATLELDGFPDPSETYTVTYKVVGTPDITYPDITVNQGMGSFTFDTLQAGNYQLFVARVEDNSPAGCAGFGDTVNIRVNPLPTLSLTAIDPLICLGDQATIEATVGVNPPVSFSLDEINGQDLQSYAITGSNTFTFEISPTQSGQHTYAASNLVDGSVPQCANTTNATVAVYVNALPTATINGTGDWCEGTAFEIPVSVTGEDDVEVEFDLGGISTLTQTFDLNGGTISAVLPVGSHQINIVRVQDISPVSCLGTGFGPFTVNVIPNPTGAISFDPDPVCLDEPVDVIFTATGNGPFEVDYIDDNQNTGTITLSPNQAILMDQARLNMDYTIVEIRDNTTPSDNLPYCSSNPNSVFAPTVNPLPTGRIVGDDAVCAGDVANLEIEFTGTSPFDATVNGTDAFTQSFSQINNPHAFTVTPTQITTYSLGNVVDANGCRAIDLTDHVVLFLENPDPIFIAQPDSACVPLVTQLLNLTENVNLSQCFLQSSNNQSNDCSTIIDNWIFNTPGQFDLQYSLTSEDGCTSTGTLTDFFTVHRLPVADFQFGPSSLTTLNKQVRLINRSTDADSNFWNIDDELMLLSTTSIETSPTIELDFDLQNALNVKLYVESEFGCTDSIQKRIPIIPITPVYIPNAFSPNGDGVNEGFRAEFDYSLVETFILRIFNRWGEEVWSSNDPEEYWFGDYQQKMVKPDVYTVRLEVLFNYANEPAVFNGAVTIVR